MTASSAGPRSRASTRARARPPRPRASRLRHAPTLEFIHDALPETARHIDDLLEKVRESDSAVAASASGATYAGDADPYKKPHAGDDEEE